MWSDNHRRSSLIDSLTGDAIPSKLSDEIFAVNFEGLDISLNLDPHPLTFNHHTFPSGFIFEIQEFQLWFLEGSCEVKVLEHPASVFMHADLKPFSIAGGVVEVSGLTEHGKTNVPLQLGFSLGETKVQDSFLLSANAKFLKAVDVGFDLNISAVAGFNLALKLDVQPLFDFDMDLSLAGPGGKDADFSLYADLT